MPVRWVPRPGSIFSGPLVLPLRLDSMIAPGLRGDYGLWEMKRVVSAVIELLLVLMSLCSISSPSDVAGLRDCDMIGWFVL